MKVLMFVLCSVILGGACYFAFQTTGVYSMEGASGDIPEGVLEEPPGILPLVELADNFELNQDPPILGRYTCPLVACGTIWVAPIPTSYCPECNTFADDFDLIDDDELD